MPIVEPHKRNKDGWRWIIHRFPIKNGISVRDMMIRDLTAPNRFLTGIKYPGFSPFFNTTNTPELTA